jgi:hypothetical protein
MLFDNKHVHVEKPTEWLCCLHSSTLVALVNSWPSWILPCCCCCRAVAGMLVSPEQQCMVLQQLDEEVRIELLSPDGVHNGKFPAGQVRGPSLVVTDAATYTAQEKD